MAVLFESSNLVSIEAARDAIVGKTTSIAGSEPIALGMCRGRVLTEDLVSPRALPVFDHSAMDGYAVCGLPGAGPFRLTGRIAAGVANEKSLRPGECVRIFTGAPVPSGAEAVAMQENVEAQGDTIVLLRPLTPGENIRRAGEDVSGGEILAPSGVLLDSRHIALAAAVGVAEVSVRRILKVAIVSTGDELVTAGGGLKPGQIFDSNRPMLVAALERPALQIRDFGILPDKREEIARFFREAAAQFDLIITTGGASVGDEDHLARALRDAGGDVHLARVAIRPGKPFTYGAIGETCVAILPGNPFAALVAGLLFVRPLVERRLGLAVSPFSPLGARAGFTHRRAATRTEFLPARVVDRDPTGLPVIERLGRGGSARLKPLIAADGLAVVAPGEDPVRHGDSIGYLPFGSAFSL